MKHDYKAAIEAFTDIEIPSSEFESVFDGYMNHKHRDAILHALKLAAKVTGDPSKEMIAAMEDAHMPFGEMIAVWDAIQIQAEKEIE